MRSWVILAAILCLAACAAVRPWTADQATMLAGWTEDRARGLHRDPDELWLRDAPPAYARVAAWAAQDGGQLSARARRWPILTRALASGRVVVVPGTGLVAPRPDLGDRERTQAEDLVDVENLDRRTIDAVVETYAGDAAKAFKAVVAARREALDTAAAGMSRNR